MEVEVHSFPDKKKFSPNLALVALYDTYWHLGLVTVFCFICYHWLPSLSLLAESTSLSKLLHVSSDLIFSHTSVSPHSRGCLTRFPGFKCNFSICVSKKTFHLHLLKTKSIIFHQKLF